MLLEKTGARRNALDSRFARKLAIAAMALLFTLSRQVHAVDAVTTLHTFTGSEGYQPSSLVQASDGNYYGTAATGGATPGNSGLGFGTVFQMTPTGTLTVLHSFSGTDGTNPTGVVIGSDGALYGTTQRGGANDAGSVFRITLSGTFTTLYSFSKNSLSEEVQPSHLTLGNDGNFYGLTAFGGSNNCGTVFQITPAGAMTTLYTFPSDSGADSGTVGLILAMDGNFYGATQSALFSVTPSGAMTTLHTFTDGEGDPVSGGLVQGADGKFYGTTDLGGANRAGSVFSYSPGSTPTALYSFSSILGSVSAQPGGLADGGDGSFYGTIQYGGQASCTCGAIFKITPSGNLSMAYYFDAGNASSGPLGTLLLGNDGRLYGTTQNTIYVFDKSQPPPPVISLAVSPNVITTGASATLTWSSINATSCTGSGAWSGVLATTGNQTVSPTPIGESDFTLVCTGDGGNATLVTGLQVHSSASVSLTLSSSTINPGGSATLSWSSTGTAAYCGATGAWNGTLPSTGSQQVSPNTAGSYTYSLSCGSAAGDISVDGAATLTVASTTTGSGKGGGGALGFEDLLGLALLFGLRTSAIKATRTGSAGVRVIVAD
jgi:uncharacterized repeat protein (TIGR03803 family)